MRRLLPLVLAVLASAALATAQDQQDFNTDAENQNVVTLAAPQPAAAQAPAVAFGATNPDWEIALGYQFNWDTLFARPRFHTSGFNADVARYFNDWFAIEGQIGIGFGNTGQDTLPENLNAKSVFLGGGPKFAYRTQSRWIPWGHVLLGLDHFRITQTGVTPEGVILGSNSTFGWLAGGGLDFRISDAFAIRGEGDYLGTHYFGTNHRNGQVVGAFVFTF